MPRIFISYSRADREFVERIARRLNRKYRDGVWYDAEIRGGDIWWEDTILPAIADCTVFIYLLSNDSIGSPYCRAELDEARRWAKWVLPVIVRPKTAVPPDLRGLLGRIQYVNMETGIDDETITDLFTGIDNLLEKGAPPAEPLSPEPTPVPVVPEANVSAPVSPPVRSDGEMSPRFPARRLALAGVAVFMVALIAVLAFVVINQLQAPVTPTSAVLAATATLTEVPAPSAAPTTGPTSIPTPTLDIVYIVQTLDAQASAAVRATNIVATTQAVIDATSTATLWTATPTATLTPTPNLTASIDAFTTARAQTATAQFFRDATATVDAYTDTPTPTATFTATSAPITANIQWTPDIQIIDGYEMALAPIGCFMMGSDDGEADEKPVHQQCFDQPFWIDRTEVTNAQYGSSGRFDGDNRPRESVNWFEARDFCASRGARLPSEREWEYAARGPDNLIYPWGNDFVADNVIYSDNSGNQTADVGSRAGGVSWVGASDLSGNVWEWVSTIYDQERFSYPYKGDDGREDNNDTNSQHVLRGGSWYYSFSSFLRASFRFRGYPDFGFFGGGFRCARS